MPHEWLQWNQINWINQAASVDALGQLVIPPALIYSDCQDHIGEDSHLLNWIDKGILLMCDTVLQENHMHTW